MSFTLGKPQPAEEKAHGLLRAMVNMFSGNTSYCVTN